MYYRADNLLAETKPSAKRLTVLFASTDVKLSCLAMPCVNGTCADTPEGEYRCTCYYGVTGKRCNIGIWVFLEWILQNKDGHLMIFTQRSILNRDGTDVDKEQGRGLNRTPFRQRTSVLGV